MKFIFIGEDQVYFDLITEYLMYWGLDFYPKSKEEFLAFRANAAHSFSSSELIATESQQTLLRKIHEFKNGSESIIYIVDYEFGDSNPEINGVDLCCKILPDQFNDKVIMLSKTSDSDDLEKINNFIVNNSHSSFISKNCKTFIEVLLEKIYSKTS